MSDEMSTKRIAELGAQVVQAREQTCWDDRIRVPDDTYKDAVTRELELEQRIRKAREILERAYGYKDVFDDTTAILLALEALEGK